MDQLQVLWNDFIQTNWHLPLWIHLIYLYCLFLGWRARQPRVISIYRIFALPFLISVWIIYNYWTGYPISFSIAVYWLSFVAIGSYVSYQTFEHTPIKADKHQKRILLPGTWSTLIILVLIFISRDYLLFLHTFHSNQLTDFDLHLDLTVKGILTGIILGRGFRFIQLYQRAHHTDLHRF